MTVTSVITSSNGKNEGSFVASMTKKSVPVFSTYNNCIRKNQWQDENI